MFPVTPTVAPVAAGVCEAQVGGEFFTTVQVCVTELEPFPTVATSVLLPEFKPDEAIFCELDAPVMALPFNVQVVTQLVSFGVTLKRVLVPLAAATRYGVVAGVAAVIEQDGRTVTSQEQTALS
jgi:hypothetical protein